MASIFKRQDRPNGKWYISYCPRPNVHKTVAGCKDYAATVALARKLETQAFERRTGVVNEQAEKLAASEARPIVEHLNDFEGVMRGRGLTDEHVRRTRRLIQSVLDGCGFTKAADLDGAKVAGFLADLKAKGKSARTVNAYGTAIKSLGRWLWRSDRLRTDPMKLVGKLNEKADPRHRRRALTDDELARLLAAAVSGKPTYGMTGPDRAMLYLTAVETGLRLSELHSLTRESFDLADVHNATVTVQAAYSKRRRLDVLPIRESVAMRLQTFLKGIPAGARVFKMPSDCNVVRMFRVDLAAARAAWLKEAEPDPKEYERRTKSTHLLPVDESGRILDFHCLRHSFISRLARAGVHPKTAQSLARHSTITLTMDAYTHSLRGDERAALDLLPPVTVQPDKPEGQRMRATGTADSKPDRAESVSILAVHRTPDGASGCNVVQDGDKGDAVVSRKNVKTLQRGAWNYNVL
jgi:integrase/recombinase XerD